MCPPPSRACRATCSRSTRASARRRPRPRTTTWSGCAKVAGSVAEERVDAEPAARRLLKERLGVEPPAVPVDVLAEPVADLADLAVGQRRRLLAEVLLEPLPQLGRDEHAE